MTASFTTFKGAALPIDDIDIPRIGHRIGVGEDELHAFMDVEAAGSGFDKQGRPKMLFEPHVFYRNLSGAERDAAVRQGLAYKSWKRGNYPADSYPRLKKAMKINETAALKAASWGLGQILGENFAMVGYDTPQDMVRAFMEDEANHLEAIVEFLIEAGIDDDLRAHRWEVVARVYNGPGYAEHNYHGRMADRYRWWARIPDTPWSPSDVPPGVDPQKNIYDGEVHEEVRRVQERLDELGYPEVGAFDGRWGTKTRAAILSFRADQGLELEPRIDNDLLAALMTADPRHVAPERANATAKDLREKGAEDIEAADKNELIGGVTAGGGALVAVTELVEQAEGYSGIAQRAMDVLGPIQSFMTDNFWIIMIVFGGIVVWQSGILKRIRVEKHRTGKDVSE